MTPPRTSAIGTKFAKEHVTVEGQTDRSWERQVEDRHAMEFARAILTALQAVVKLAIKKLFREHRSELAKRRGLDVVDDKTIEQLTTEHVDRLGRCLQEDVGDLLSRTDDGSFEFPVATYGRRYADQVAQEEGLQVMEEADEQSSEGESAVTFRASLE
ncbi:MAG: hypothetical protein WC840_02750 [Candidatus Peribacteraceae bacterium]